jgi:hypothetical protein
MPYVRRDSEGRIASLHREPDQPDQEFLEANDPEARSFVGADGGHFAALDADFVRVIEDVIDVLILRNVINISDFPPEAQTKLLTRKGMRERLGQQTLRLFGDAGQGGGVI